jgi:syntaxin-binding protein 5
MVDPRPRVRLIAVGPSGEARVHTLERRSDNATWEVTNHLEAEGIEEALISQDSSFIFEAKTGFRSRADAHGLTTILSPEILAGGQDDRHWIWVIAGAKGARAYLDINGDRVARADWPAKFGKVIEVKMVERTDAMVLVAYTTQCQALVYSLPKLELLHAFDMPYSGKAYVKPHDLVLSH